MIYLLLLLLLAAAAGVFAAIPKAGAMTEGTTKAERLSFSDLLMLAQQGGFPESVAYIAAAIALAESGGNPMAYNPETASGAPQERGSYGLWQIYLHAHPEFENWNLYDPLTNAQAAYNVYSNAESFRPWSTFKNSAYLAHVPESYNV